MNRREKVLVVDDKGINRYMLGEIFSDQYEIVEASDGYKAIDKIELEKNELAVILLDIMMPKLDGFGVLE